MVPKVTKTWNGLRMGYAGGVGGFTQQYLVENILVDQNNGEPGDIFEQAVGAIGISYTAPHPTIQGVYAYSFDGWCTVQEAASVSRAIATILIGFQTPTFIPLGGVKVQLSGANAQTVLNRWPNGPQKGQVMLVGWNPDRTRSFPDQNNPTIIKQQRLAKATNGDKFDTIEIPIEAPNAILTLTRTEFAFPAASYAMKHLRNSKAWMGFAKDTVMLRDFNAVNMVGGGTIIPTFWVCTYVFEITDDPDRWLKVAFYIDDHTGKPKEDVDLFDGTNNGYSIIDPAPGPSVDFNKLKFPATLLV